MKKIILAWIEQHLEFDSEMEYAVFYQDLKDGKRKFRIISTEKLSDGKFKVHLMKQYNNNNFPEGGESGDI